MKSASDKNFLFFSKKGLQSWSTCGNIVELIETATNDPGVAKFGIALEWGSRGPEFESQHSDQKQPSKEGCFSFV